METTWMKRLGEQFAARYEMAKKRREMDETTAAARLFAFVSTQAALVLALLIFAL